MRRPHPLLLSAMAIVLLGSGCHSRATRSLGPRSVAAERGIKPASLSGFIRGIYKLSSEASHQTDERAQLLKESPELESLILQVEADSSDADARERLVAEYMSRQFYWSAYTLLTDTLPANIDEPDTNLNLAIIWDSWAQYDLALQYGERAIANGATSARAFETLGRVHLHRNEADEAIAWYGQALEAQRTAPVFANRGYAFILKADWEAARAHLEEALILDNKLEQARNNLAFVLSNTGDQTGALEHLLQAGRPAVAYNNMGVLYLRQKNTLEAQHYFQEALRLEPGYEMALKNLSALEAFLPPPSILRLPAVVNDTEDRKDVAQVQLDRIPLVAARFAMLQSKPAEVPQVAASLPARKPGEGIGSEIKELAFNSMPITDNSQRPALALPAPHEEQSVVQEYRGQGLRMAGFAGLIFVTGLLALRSSKNRSAARRDRHQ